MDSCLKPLPAATQAPSFSSLADDSFSPSTVKAKALGLLAGSLLTSVHPRPASPPPCMISGVLGLGPTDPACFLAALLCSLHCPLWLQPPSSAASQEHFNCMSHLAHEKTNTPLCSQSFSKSFLPSLFPPHLPLLRLLSPCPQCCSHSHCPLGAPVTGLALPSARGPRPAVPALCHPDIHLGASFPPSLRKWHCRLRLSQDHWHHPYSPPAPAPFSRPTALCPPPPPRRSPTASPAGTAHQAISSLLF